SSWSPARRTRRDPRDRPHSGRPLGAGHAGRRAGRPRGRGRGVLRNRGLGLRRDSQAAPAGRPRRRGDRSDLPARRRHSHPNDGGVRGVFAPRPRGTVLRRPVVRVAVVAEWYPSPGDPVLGICAHRQAVAARDAGAEVRVLALRRPIPPLSVARQLFHIPPATGPLGDWIEGARTSLRPLSLDGIAITPVPFLAPPRPISYGSWGYWMAPPLARALDRLYD